MRGQAVLGFCQADLSLDNQCSPLSVIAQDTYIIVHGRMS